MLKKKNLSIIAGFCNSKTSALKAIWAEAVFNRISASKKLSRHENPLVDDILNMNLS